MDPTALLGLEPDDWTAVGTVVLALATGVLVILTRRMARTAERSAADSAQAATQSAKAAEAANELLLAQTPVDFSVKYTLYRSLDVGMLAVTCEGSPVFVHELRHVGGAGFPTSGDIEGREPTAEEMKAVAQGIAPTTVCPPEPNDFPLLFPHLLHGGETVRFLYPFQAIEPIAPLSSIRVRVAYSFSETGVSRSIERDVSTWSEL